MKLQILVLAILLVISQALFPTENHLKKFTNYGKGCYDGQCWSYCSDTNMWCYTKLTIWADQSGRISCSGSTYSDNNCPFYTQEMTLHNCDSSCFW